MDASGHLFLAMIDTEMQRMSHKGDAMMGGDKKVTILVDDVRATSFPLWSVSEWSLYLSLTDFKLLPHSAGEGAEDGVHEHHVVGHGPV